MRNLPDVTFKLQSQDPWIQDSPFESIFYHALSAILPEYERKVIEVCCVAKFPESGPLRDDIIQFIRQEGSHSRIHTYYNDQLQKSGYNLESILAVSRLFGRIYAKHMPLGIRLGLSAAGEHLTGMIAKYFIKHQARYEATAHPGPYNVWYWHGIEELEHKAAMHDLMDSHGYRYATRLFSYLLINVWFVVPLVIYGMIVLSWQDRSILKRRFWANGFQFMFGENGFAPIFLRFTLEYLKPNFHPSSDPSDELLVAEYDAMHQPPMKLRKV